MPDFSDFERKIQQIFKVGTRFIFRGQSLTVEQVGKPRPQRGEAKSDIYILASPGRREVKISAKQENAQFLENKISAQRAEEILGVNWSQIIINSLVAIRTQIENRKLVFRTAFGNTNKGSITLGWKYEIMNRPGGKLSGLIRLTREQIVGIYKGNNLSKEKRDATVNGTMIPNSGVAEYILTSSIASIKTLDDVMSHLESIDEFIDRTKPPIAFACKALNYRSLHDPPKWDGNRPLALYVKWSVQKRKLAHEIITNEPLVRSGNEVAGELMIALKKLGIKSTADLNSGNVANPAVIHS